MPPSWWNNYGHLLYMKGPSWPWSYDSWIYNYLWNQCLSSLMWVRISISARCTTLCDKVCQWLATGRWFFPDPPVSSTNKTDRHDIAEILLKVALNTIKQTNTHTCICILNSSYIQCERKLDFNSDVDRYICISNLIKIRSSIALGYLYVRHNKTGSN